MVPRMMIKVVIAVLAILFFAAPVSRNVLAGETPQVNRARIIREIQHELRMMPYYGVFDWIEFEVQPDGAVTLRGKVIHPSTKSEAEARVKDIEGVKSVINEIEVLPPSPADDRLRIALYRTIYGWDSPLFRYAHQATPSIHIIVDRGRATLKGIVANRGDAQQAYMRARAVPGLFDVKNELIVESEMPR